MASNGFNRASSVLEIKNTAAVAKLSNESLSGLTARLDSHESGLNTNAHGIPNIAGLQTSLNSKENAFSKNTAFNKNFGSSAGTICQGDDIRLSDNRTPLAHTHSSSDITGGYTGTVTVVTGVDFSTQTTTTKVVTYDNGIVTSVV